MIMSEETTREFVNAARADVFDLADVISNTVAGLSFDNEGQSALAVDAVENLISETKARLQTFHRYVIALAAHKSKEKRGL